MLPFIEIFQLKIPSFFLVISVATTASLFVLAGSLKSLRFENVRTLGFEKKFLLDLALVMMVFGFIGGRAMHVLFELPEYYKEHPQQIWMFWQGGFVFYGGFFLALLAASLFLFIKTKKIQKPFLVSFITLADFYAPPLALAYAIGRLGCFMEGCCFGRFSEMPWAIQLRHPTALYASAMEFVTFFLLKRLFNETEKVKTGEVFALWLVLHALNRIIMEFFRDDFRGTFYYGFSISTIISLILLILGFYLQNLVKPKTV